MSRATSIEDLKAGKPLLERAVIDTLFSEFIGNREVDLRWLDACKPVLIDKTNITVFSMFGRSLPPSDIDRANTYLKKFINITSGAGYLPPQIALKKIENWILEEKNREIKKGRRPDLFEREIYPWLISFFETVFKERVSKSDNGRCVQFIEKYFYYLSKAFDAVTFADPDGGDRVLRKPALTKTPGAIRHALAASIKQSTQHRPLIELKIRDELQKLDCKGS